MKKTYIVIICFSLLILCIGGFAYSKKNIKETYVACGCGSCNRQNNQVKYIYNSNEFEKLKSEDQSVKQSKLCEVAGCTPNCIEYRLVKLI